VADNRSTREPPGMNTLMHRRSVRIRLPIFLLGIAVLFVLPAKTSWAQAESKAKRPVNRLAKETSPYLLLHAHNPVDWYPWGPEAFARAKAENKPIFLSIGYSSCYWCHVMERECFKDPAIAKLMNKNFINIKVDREERPDVDQIYMTALQAFANGGWPLSMFLTPDGRPFYGGTYFPPKERNGMRGFPEVLEGVAEAWRDERPQLEEAANRLTDAVKQSIAKDKPEQPAPLTRELAKAGREQLAELFDPEHGGFGFSPDNPRRPKFPEPSNLVFLLDEHRRENQPNTKGGAKEKGQPTEETALSPLAMVVKTLDHMARGGIRDQIAGGYHRYSTDRAWLVPHFEKMLYDNAQLAAIHLSAFELTGDVRWRREAEATLGFIARSMTSPEGAFYSAIDAETDADEGGYYVWTRAEVESNLGKDTNPAANAFGQVYGLKRDPNFEKDRYVLFEPRSRAEQAESLKVTPEALEAQLKPLRLKLLSVRERRSAPLLDDKVLTSWNGLMIATYANAFQALKDPKYRQTAEKAADFLLSKLQTPDGRLLRTYRVGQAKLPAYLDDYAFLAHGLIQLHRATGDTLRLEQARKLTDRMIEDFHDQKDGGFFFTADNHEALLARPKDPYDEAIPSGNSVAIRNLVALSKGTGGARYLEIAEQALQSFSVTLAQSPAALPMLQVALGEYLDAREAQGNTDVAKADPAPGADFSKAMVVVSGKLASNSKPATSAAEIVVEVTVSVKPGWHLNANPAGEENLIPTTLVLPRSQPGTLKRVEYPEGELKQLDPNGWPIPLYEGTVTLKAHVQLDPKAQPAPEFLNLELRHQACNDVSCLAPETLTVKVPITSSK